MPLGSRSEVLDAPKGECRPARDLAESLLRLDTLTNPHLCWRRRSCPDEGPPEQRRDGGVVQPEATRSNQKQSEAIT